MTAQVRTWSRRAVPFRPDAGFQARVAICAGFAARFSDARHVRVIFAVGGLKWTREEVALRTIEALRQRWRPSRRPAMRPRPTQTSLILDHQWLPAAPLEQLVGEAELGHLDLFVGWRFRWQASSRIEQRIGLWNHAAYKEADDTERAEVRFTFAWDDGDPLETATEWAGVIDLEPRVVMRARPDTSAG